MDIRIKITRDGSNRIVTRDLEDYLRDVVPSEIKAGYCPLQAQMAQAIAARSYAVYYRNPAKPYDLDDTSDNNQAYGARPPTATSNRAVAATTGMVLTYNGKIANTVYTDSNGGRTVSALSRWGNACPYLIDKPDPYDNSPRVNGHGVGMSQTGAAQAAKQGLDYKSILAFYYPGCRVTKLKEDNKMEDCKLSANFRLSEFFAPEKYADVLRGRTAPTIKASDIDPRIIRLMEGLRGKLRTKWPGAVIVITPHGGYRPDPLNAMVGGASGSQHRKGNAADFRLKLADGSYLDAPTLAVWSECYMAQLGIRGGVGMYKTTHTYIHVDARGSNVAWYDSYSSAGCPGQGGRPCIYRKGNKGAGVVLIQRALGIAADGKYGANTAKAVKAWQAAHGLAVDGVYGPVTNKAMGGVLPW